MSNQIELTPDQASLLSIFAVLTSKDEGMKAFVSQTYINYRDMEEEELKEVTEILLQAGKPFYETLKEIYEEKETQ